MKIQSRLSTLFASTLFIVAALFSSYANAKEINLYADPKSDAKVLGKVDLAEGVIPIFSSKEGDWMKVGDPRNGNVGWIKSSDMTTPGAPASFTFTQKVINDKSGPHTYQLMQFGKPDNVNSAQAQEFIKNIQAEQQMIQMRTQKAIQEMMNDINSLYQRSMASGFANFPIFVPVVVVPAEKLKNQNSNVKPSTTTQSPSSKK